MRVEALHVGPRDVVEDEVARHDAGADLVPTLLEAVVDRLPLLLIQLGAAGGDQPGDLLVFVAADVLRSRWVEEGE